MRRIPISLDLEVEQRGPVLRAIEGIRCVWYIGTANCLGRGVGVEAPRGLRWFRASFLQILGDEVASVYIERYR